MDKITVINKTKEFVKSKLYGECTGHDWFHIQRVHKTACYIGKEEKADMFVVELAALLHDISDWKFNGGDENGGAREAGLWLNNLDVDSEVIERIVCIISTMSFKGGTNKVFQDTIEGKVVQDADRLDAIGAIGIARAFAYGGFKGREIYNPEIKTADYKSFEEYKNSKGTTINHFYEKLLLLKELMNTQTGKIIAEERHEFMKSFLEQFMKEWNYV